MYIGKLNDRIQGITVRCTEKEHEAPQKLLESGNPFYGELFSVEWKTMMTNGADLHVRFPEKTAVDCLVLHFGEKSRPEGISLYSAEKPLLYSRRIAETGKKLSEGIVTLAVEDVVSALTIRFDSEFSDITLEEIEIYGSADMEQPAVYPIPRSCTFGDGSVPFSRIGAIEAAGDDALAAAKILREKWAEEGFAVGETGDVPVRFAADPAMKKNAYSVSVSEKGIALSASDRRGLVLAAETLLKLSAPEGVRVCEIRDEPFCEFRGVHLYLPSVEQLPLLRRLVRWFLSPMGYNFIIMEVAGTMEFKSHPEINEAFLHAIDQAKKGLWPAFPHGGVAGGTVVKQDTVRALVDEIAQYGIRVVPEIQSLGHVQFMTQAHPEIAERAEETADAETTDERLADVPPSAFYAHCYCPSNPKSYEILFDLIDEIVDVFRPDEYVHMGHDEVYQIGVCPRCKGKDPAQLYADDVCRIHEYLAKKGLKMMIWSDMLQPCTRYMTYPAADRIPKDILMLDFIWYFHLKDDIEDNLLGKGFELLYGNLYSSHFPRYESRIRKAGVRGGQISAWVQNNAYVLGKEGKFYDFLYTAGMLWSPEYTSFCRHSYDTVISAMIPALREKIYDVSYPSRRPGCTERVLLQSELLDPSKASGATEIPVDGTCDSIVFAHTCGNYRRRIPWGKLEDAGAYTVQYDDGTTEKIPVSYGGNVGYWARRQNEPLHASYYRHTGYTASWFCDGKRVPAVGGVMGTVYEYEWINPHPEKKIARVTLSTEGCPDAGLCVYAIRAVTCE